MIALWCFSFGYFGKKKLVDGRAAILVVTFLKIQLEINNKLHIDLYLTNHELSQKERKENERRI